MRLSFHPVLAAILLTVLSLSSTGPAGVHLLTTLLTHHHGHEHTVLASGDGGLILSHATPDAESGFAASKTHDHVVPDSELDAVRTSIPLALLQTVAVFTLTVVPPQGRIPPPTGTRETTAVANGPPLYLQHQILLI